MGTNFYGDEIADPVGWVAELEPPDALQRRQEEEMTSYPGYYEQRGWRDPAGLRFEPREFS